MPTRATYDIINTVEKLRPCGQAVKTEPSQGSIPGSIPGKVTKQVKGEPVSIRRRIRLYCIFQDIEKAAGASQEAPASLYLCQFAL